MAELHHQNTPKKPLQITVVIPAFNEEKYLPQTLEALKKQTYPYFDIMVVDNNSTDRTAEIARAYGAHVHLEKKQGYVYSLNSGLLAAKGDIISVTDADTRPTPHWLENIAKAFENDQVVCVTGPGHIKTENPLLNKLADSSYDMFLQFHAVIHKPHMSGGFNMSFRRWALRELGGLDPKFEMSPDIDLGLRMTKLGRVLFVKEAVVVTSTRRWDKNLGKAFTEYAKGYFYSVWLRKPPPVKQTVIR